MSDPTPPNPANAEGSKPRPGLPGGQPVRKRSDFNNWISAIGGVVAVGALFSFAFLVWMDFTQGDRNPYLGIFTYIVAPGFLIGGLALAGFGAWAQHRWAIKHAATMPDKWRLDFGAPQQRQRLLLSGSVPSVSSS